MKRLIDTGLWEKKWFRKLSLDAKAFWLYLNSACDNAGVWETDFLDIAEFYLNKKIDFEKVLDEINNGKQRIIEFNPRKLWLVDFINTQYNVDVNKLNDKINTHKNVKILLSKHGIIDVDFFIENMETKRQHENTRQQTKKAIKSGRLTKQPCKICGATNKIHAHHDDYNNPLSVVWLCASCHAKLHRGTVKLND